MLSSAPDGRTHFDASDIESDEVAAENDGEMHKSGSVAVAEKSETENSSTNDEKGLPSPEPDGINADIQGAQGGQNDNKYYQVNIHGKINSELDEVDLNTGVIYEDKCAEKLYMQNPDHPQTEQAWAEKQIYNRTINRIESIQQDNFRMSSKVSTSYPDIDKLKEIDTYIFRVDADTPALREAVYEAIAKLKIKYPKYNFSATFGGKK